MRITGLNLLLFGSYVKRFFFVCVLGAITSYAGAQSPVSGTFTINSNQPTAGTNFQTYTEAIFSLAYGVNGPVVFNVAPNSGPYNEQININAITGASATNTITFNGHGTTITNASTSSLARAVIKLDGAKHIIFDSLTVLPVIDPNNSSTYGWGFGLVRDADSNIVRKCTITVGVVTLTAQNTMGIYIGSTDNFPDANGLSYCDGNIITQNTITGGHDGIMLDNNDGNNQAGYTPIYNNQITNNTIRNFAGTGISLGWCSNTLIQGNDISGVIPTYASAIYIDGQCGLTKILGNKIHNISASVTSADFTAINVAESPASASTINIIANNAIYDIRTPTSQYGFHVSLSSSYYYIYHNTVLLDTAGAASSSTTAGLYYEANSNINFENNIISLSRSGSGSRYGIYTTTAANPAFICDYNDIVIASGSSNYIGRNVSTSYASLALWQSGTLRDAHSTTQDPLFTSVATGNLKPTSAAMDNMGTFVGISTDINGDVRNNTNPDMGAYEFLTPACSSTVTGGSSVGIPVQAICPGGTITLNVSNNSFGTGQTYQWQSATSLNGTYTNVSSALVTPAYDVQVLSTLYYRALITCGTGSATSTPVQIAAYQPLSGNGYTINSALPTSATNFKSFADALSALNCGMGGPVVITVAPGSGSYNEQVSINAIPGMSAVNTLTIKGNGDTLTYAANNTSEREVLKLNGANYVTIDSLVIIGTGTVGTGVLLVNNANHNTIKNCTVSVTTAGTSSSYAGISISGSAGDPIGAGTTNLCDSNSIINNKVNGGYYGIIIYGDPTALAYNDTIAGNTVKDFYTYGIYTYGTNNMVLSGNDVSRPTRATTGSTVYCVYLNGINTGAAVAKNRIHNVFDALLTNTGAFNGIYSNNADATSAAPVTISNNLIYNVNGLGAQVGLYNSSSDYNLYYNNTVSLDNTNSGTPTTTARGIYQTSSATGLQYKNNLVYIKRNGTGVNNAIYMATTGTTYTADYNDYYVSGTGTNNVGTNGSTAYSTVLGWTNATSKDAHTVAVDPVYTNAAGGNLLPTASALDNKGTAVGITTDISNVTRSTTTPDIGAYEFTGTVLPVTLTSIAAVKTTTDVLVSWSTATEINTKVFEVERSADGSSFATVGSEDAKGNSSTTQSYVFTDKGAVVTATSNILYYRLRIVDNDGSFSYSPVVTVLLGNNTQIVKVFPNPVTTELYASVVTGAAGNALIELQDATGRKILHQQQQVAQGASTIAVNGIDRLQKGVYFVTISINNNQYVFKIVK